MGEASYFYTNHGVIKSRLTPGVTATFDPSALALRTVNGSLFH